MNDIKEIAVKLYGLCAAGGCEREMSECISEYLKDIESFKDAHGTIVFHKKGTGTPAVILTALDIPSLFTTHRDKDGFMRFCTYGVDHKKIHKSFLILILILLYSEVECPGDDKVSVSLVIATHVLF